MKNHCLAHSSPLGMVYPTPVKLPVIQSRSTLYIVEDSVIPVGNGC